MAQARRDRRADARQSHEGAHVTLDLPFDADATYLDDHLPSVRQAGGVDLRDRRSSERLALEVKKELAERAAKRPLDLADRMLCREWGDVILQRLQRGDVFVGQHVATEAERLAELDECRSKPR